jgi:hypothetical protein
MLKFVIERDGRVRPGNRKGNRDGDVSDHVRAGPTEPVRIPSNLTGSRTRRQRRDPLIDHPCHTTRRAAMSTRSATPGESSFSCPSSMCMARRKWPYISVSTAEARCTCPRYHFIKG